jgi:hypothetical protein
MERAVRGDITNPLRFGLDLPCSQPIEVLPAPRSVVAYLTCRVQLARSPSERWNEADPLVPRRPCSHRHCRMFGRADGSYRRPCGCDRDLRREGRYPSAQGRAWCTRAPRPPSRASSSSRSRLPSTRPRDVAACARERRARRRNHRLRYSSPPQTPPPAAAPAPEHRPHPPPPPTTHGTARPPRGSGSSAPAPTGAPPVGPAPSPNPLPPPPPPTSPKS